MINLIIIVQSDNIYAIFAGENSVVINSVAAVGLDDGASGSGDGSVGGYFDRTAMRFYTTSFFTSIQSSVVIYNVFCLVIK